VTGPGERTAGRRLALLLAGAALTAVLNWSYAHVESRIFGFLGFAYRPPTWEVRALLTALGLLPLVWLPVAPERPAAAGLATFYALVVLPSVHLPVHLAGWTTVGAVAFAAFMVGNFALMSAVALAPPLRLQGVAVDPTTLRWALLAATASLTLVAGALNGFQLDLSVADVYVRRFAARESVPAGSLASYLLALLAVTLMPITLAVGLAARARVMVIVSLVATAGLFSIFGQKSILLTPVFVAGLHAIASRRRPVGTWLLAALTAGVGLSATAHVLLGDVIASSFFTHRLFVAPALTTARYFTYFRDHPLYYLSGGLLRGLIESPYERPMSLVLGATYFEVPGMNLNTNIWASAFGDGGLAAVCLASVVAGAVLWLVESCARGPGRVALVPIAGFMGYLYAEMALPTALITGGLLPSLALCYLLYGASRRAEAALP
jgi:hypothetical protein